MFPPVTRGPALEKKSDDLSRHHVTRIPVKCVMIASSLSFPVPRYGFVFPFKHPMYRSLSRNPFFSFKRKKHRTTQSTGTKAPRTACCTPTSIEAFPHTSKINLILLECLRPSTKSYRFFQAESHDARSQARYIRCQKHLRRPQAHEKSSQIFGHVLPTVVRSTISFPRSATDGSIADNVALTQTRMSISIA